MKITPTAVADGALYLTDGGAIYCGAHLGVTARMTGRDLSGQPILRITPETARAARDMGCPCACETCGRSA